MNSLKYSLSLCGVLTTLLVSSPLPSEQETGTVAQEATSYKTFSKPFIQAVKKTAPAVVSIRSQITKSASDEIIDPFSEDVWSFFFSQPQQRPQQSSPQKRVEVTLGSGFLVSSDGHILTNNHNVDDSTKITVQLPDGREFEAKKIGEDASTDIALIKIEGKDFPFLTFADHTQVDIGEWVIAIGNPLGLQATVTTGVISATGRSDLDIEQVEDFLQTDAAINRGNSGGPLVNLNGDVVGMNTAIATNTGGYMGISFAISSHLLKEVMHALLANGKIERGFLGVALQPITNDLASALGLEKPKGALIADIVPNGPAEKSGLKSGDVILKVNGIEIESAGALKKSISFMRPGQSVTLSLLRSGKHIELSATIEPFPTNGKGNIDAQKYFGMGLESLTGEIAKRFDLSTTTGIVVTQVDPSGSAYAAGIRRGHVIVAVNGTPVSTIEEFSRLCATVEKGRKVLLQLRIGNHNQYVSLPIE